MISFLGATGGGGGAGGWLGGGRGEVAVEVQGQAVEDAAGGAPSSLQPWLSAAGERQGGKGREGEVEGVVSLEKEEDVGIVEENKV